MDSIDLIKTFQEVASRGSFSRAATALNLSKATVSKYVAELETRFGVRLLNRSTRSVSLTDAGELLLERSKPVIEMMALTTAELQEHASTPRGRLRVSAPAAMGQGDLPNLMGQFLGYYPDVNVSLHLSNRMVDLAEEGVDVALRFGPITDANLIVRKLILAEMALCASPRYWKKHGKPTHPAELASHDALTVIHPGPYLNWQFMVDGKPVDVPVKARMEATEAGPLIEVATQGYGVIYLPKLLIQPQLDAGELETALEAHVRSDLWLSAAYLQRRHNSAALKAFLDFLETRIGARSNYASKKTLAKA